jgi:6-pyruvoyl-tetrahydropterin synthase
LHGHTYHIEVNITGEVDDKGLFVMDFTEIKKVLDRYDHGVLVWADDVELREKLSGLSKAKVILLKNESSAENIAEEIAHEIVAILGDKIQAIEVEVTETPKGKAKFSYVPKTSSRSS